MTMNSISFAKIAALLVVLGALNWGLIGAFDYNVIDAVFSGVALKVVYVLIGLAALMGVISLADEAKD